MAGNRMLEIRIAAGAQRRSVPDHRGSRALDRTATKHVFAGWSGTTDWFRNVQAATAIVQRGAGSYVQNSALLSGAEANRKLARYGREHRLAARYLFARYTEGVRVINPTILYAAPPRSGLFAGVAFPPTVPSLIDAPALSWSRGLDTGRRDGHQRATAARPID